jgi:hypothetical protein
MKKFLTIIMAVGITLYISNASFAYPNSVTLNGFLHSNDGFDATVAKSEVFAAGIYRFTVSSGAWESQSWEGNNGSFWFWSFNIYQDASNQFLLGDDVEDSSFNPHASASDALNAHLGDSILITQPTDGNIWFYINDPDSPRDNQFGSNVTASVTLVPEPVSSALFVIGIGVLACRKYLKKRKVVEV